MDHKLRKIRHKRIRSAMHGTAVKPRLAVFKSLSHMYAQLIDDDKGTTLAHVTDLKMKKGTKMEKAKEIGLEIAKLAKNVKVEAVVFDRAGFRYHGRVKAVAEAAREGGLKF